MLRTPFVTVATEALIEMPIFVGNESNRLQLHRSCSYDSRTHVNIAYIDEDIM